MLSSIYSIPLLSAEFLAQFEAAAAAATASQPKEQKRCPTCRHKLLLSDTACRCGLRHCGKHRLPEEHGCTFDHRAHDKAALQKAVVACVSDKIGNRC
jgi:predicted nucleic acid binding AN1-type Zn finger protein